MIKKLLKLIMLFTLFGVVGKYGMEIVVKPSTVRAFGELSVDFHVPEPDPIFEISNWSPGKAEDRNIDVANGGAVSRMVAVKGVKKSGIGLESGLHLEIRNGTDVIYDNTLENFLNLAQGFEIEVLNPNQSETYNFKVTFPESADNQYQNKSVVFDLSFGVITSDHVVINEVYYIANGVHEEWVELYNPTSRDISLKNWSLTDSSGKSTVVHANKIIKAGGFALLSKDASVWKLWNEDRTAIRIELGGQIGNGLGNTADVVVLKNAAKSTVDQIDWDTENLGVTTGSSIERLVPGYDTDQDSDWQANSSPTPGN
jgi:hypothetical protein